MTAAVDPPRCARQLLVGAWAFGESLSWPLLPDMIVGALAAQGSRAEAARLATFATVGSAVGALAHYRLAAGGVRLPLPMTTPRMVDAVDAWLGHSGFLGFARQPLSGVPHKIFAARSPAHGLTGGDVVAATVVFRGPRMVATAFGAVVARSVLQPVLARFTTNAPVVAGRTVAATCFAGFGLALAGMQKRWR